MTDRRPIQISPIVDTLSTSLSTSVFKPLKISPLKISAPKMTKKKEIVDLPQFTTKLLDEIKVIENENSDEIVPDCPLVSAGAESPAENSCAELQAPIGSTNGTSSGYGSEGYISEEERKHKKETQKVETLKVLDIRDEHTHCARCHKTFDPLSASNAEKRCLLPHPTKMVIPIRRDGDGTHFVCLCCRTEFKLPKMTFYEAGVNSMLTGYCFIGQHTADQDDIDFQYDGGAALSCEEAGCIEFFV
jgi:hypothetical protein